MGIGKRAREIAALALLIGLCGAAPALAQTGETRLINTPAETFAMAPGGVDLRTGRYAASETDLAIGGDSGALALTRSLTADVPGHANPFGSFSHNWDIMVSEMRVNYDDPQQGGQDYRIFVHFGGRSQTYKSRHDSGIYHWGFQQESRGGFAPLTFTGDKAGAAVTYTYRATDGTVAEFRALGALGSGDCSHERRCAYVSRITEPDGTILTFDYWASGNPTGGGARLRSVTSSRGYALLFEGTLSYVTRACVVNLALGPLPASCASGALANATYAYEGALSPYLPVRLAGVTGPDNATASFGYGTGTMSFTRPGESAPWLTNTLTPKQDEQGMTQAIVTHQSFADGSSYSYGYGQAPVTTANAANPTIAGGGYTDGLGRTTSVTYAWPLLHNPGNPGSQCTPYCPPDQPDDFLNWVYQQTPGPVEIVDALGRTTLLDYCDPIPMAQLPANEHNRCVVVPLVSFTDPEGARTALEYDGYQNITKATRHPRTGSTLAPIITSAVYDIANPRSATRPLSMTDAMGNTTNYTYAPEHGGLLTRTGPAPAPGGVRPQTRHVYAQRSARRADGSALAPIWVRTTTSICRTSAATGNPASPCAAAGDEVLTQYDYGPESGPNLLLLRGQTVTATDGGVATTLRTCYGYDALGRRISETSPNANLASCPAGPPSTALPYTNSTRYDADGRVTGTISADPDGAGTGNPFLAVRNSYDPAGRLIKVETGSLAAWPSESVAPADWGVGFAVARTAETRYDPMSRKVREWTREGAAGAVRTMTEYSYDLAGRLTCTAIRMNPAVFAFTGTPNACVPDAEGTVPNDHGPDRISRNVYDAAGQLVQQRVGSGGEEGAEATFAYNLAGQRVAVIDGNGNRAQLVYDGHGRQICWMFPSTTRPSAYNDATQASALASAGALSGAISNGECASGDYELYGYDPNGNRTSLRKRDGVTLTYQYDALGRVSVKIVPERPAPHPYPLTAAQTRDVHYGYDLRNLQLFARFDSISGEGVTSQYDGFGRLALSTIIMDGTAHSFAYHYDRNGNRIWFDGTSGYYSARTYDGLDRVTSLVDPHGTVVRIGYDAAGRRSGLDSGLTPTSATTLGYDGIGRLASLGHDFAGTGNNVAWSYARNPAGQIGSITRNNDGYAWTGAYNVNRVYTTNGLNQYTAAGPAGFTYDANGNLVTSPGPAQNEVLTYVYDVENRLVGRTSNGASPTVTLAYDPLGRLWRVQGAAGTTRFLYDGDALAIETDGTGSVLRAFAHGPGSDEPLVWYEVPGGWRRLYPRADHQGSIVAAGGDNGALALMNRYDEYGIPAGTNSGRFQYTGQIWLPELGLYHYKARVYSPTLGRFLQTDPVGYEDQFNLYAYVGNDPVNLADPDGKQVSCPRMDCPPIPRMQPEVRAKLLPEVRSMPISAGNRETGVQIVGSPGNTEVRREPQSGSPDPENPMAFRFTPVRKGDGLQGDGHAHPNQARADERLMSVRAANQASDTRNLYPSRQDFRHMGYTGAPFLLKNTAGGVLEGYRGADGRDHIAIVELGTRPLGSIPRDLEGIVVDPYP